MAIDLFSVEKKQTYCLKLHLFFLRHPMLIIICFVSGWFIKCVPEIYFFTLKEKEQEEKEGNEGNRNLYCYHS